MLPEQTPNYARTEGIHGGVTAQDLRNLIPHMDQLFPNAEQTRYRISVHFASLRSMHQPLAFSVMVWETAKRLNGEGDASLFRCSPVVRPPPGVALPTGCGKYIPASCAGNRVVCPHCKAWWRPDALADAVFYRLPVDKAAEVLAGVWRSLEGNADFLAIYSPKDIRVATLAGDAKLEEARRLRGAMIYRLHRILRDTQEGKSLEQALRGFLLA